MPSGTESIWQIEMEQELVSLSGVTTNRKATVVPEQKPAQKFGIPFSSKCGLMRGRRVRVIRGC
jgi:hypothetical protein